MMWKQPIAIRNTAEQVDDVPTCEQWEEVVQNGVGYVSRKPGLFLGSW